jgi:hypothetical protein
MTFVLGGSVKFAPQVAPHLSARLDMPYEAGHELGWHVAVRTRCANAKLIRVMRALCQLLEGRVHFMAGSTKRDGFRVLKTADEAARKSNADDESKEAAGRYSEEEPALGAAPKPSGEALGHGLWRGSRLRRCHVELSLALGRLAPPRRVTPELPCAVSRIAGRWKRKFEVDMSAPRSNGCPRRSRGHCP